MALKLNHIHLKTHDPKKTADFYVENLGATVEAELGTNGYRLDLHGLKLNVTTHIASQTREQLYGMEHIAIDCDAGELDGLVQKLKANGTPILEETSVGGGRRVCFFEGPDGVQLEFIEMKA